MKKIILFTIGILILNSVYADIPIGYYDSASGLTGDALKSALHNIIDNHAVTPYSNVSYILDETDIDPDNSSNLILIYTGNSIISNWDGGTSWNKEHVWAKSHGFPDDNETAYSDIHNLKPAHPAVNTDRSDRDFDEGGTPHDIATECYYTSTTWEPRDEVKGDVARIMFYMATRYEGDVSGEPDLELVENITTYPNPEFGILSVLLQWNIDDPVSEFERNRNEVIYSYQNNRNPFIDHPEYISKIWGGGYTNPPPSFSSVSNIPEEPTASESVTVTATIADDSEVVDAELHWGLISGALMNTISMTNTTGNTYETSSDIPAQTDGTIVYYELEATDDSSGVATSEEYSFIVENNPPAVILEEKFTSCPGSGWITYSVSGNKNWTCGSGYMSVNAFGGDVACDDWLISPALNLDSYNGELLSFSSWTKFSDTYYPTIELKYSTDYSGSGNPNVATWTDLSAIWSAENSQAWTESGEIDLSGIEGTSVYIAFQYTSSGTGASSCSQWEIDNILLLETPNILPHISKITNTPVTPTESEDVTVTATITDEDGTVSGANIKWGTTSGTYPNTVSMSKSGDDYSGIIPSQTGGTIVYYVIEATDNTPETRQSPENMVAFNTAGNSVPVISNLEITPDMPSSANDVVVSATITDSDGTISLAQLKWGTSAGDYINTMNLNASDDLYSSFIPARSESTEIYYIIYTTDNDGGSAQSSEGSYIVNNPPEISNIAIDPTTPTNNDDVMVSASISDANSTIQSAILKYNVNSSTFTNVTMYVSGSKQKGVIPKQEVGDTILFSITATDNYGGSKTSSYGTYIVADATGIRDLTFKDATLYPNPASEELTISLQDYSGKINVQIYSIIGSLVYSEKTTINNSHKISLSEIESGIYFVKIEYGKNTDTQKIIIKK